MPGIDLQQMNEVYKVGIYLRLSREDDPKEVSESISNQREYLLKYVRAQSNWILVDIYADDGYSGTNFDRPAFKRMISDVENNKVNLIISKDLSRLGRDYIDTGNYLERYFPQKHVRYIALNDGIDTFANSSNNDMSPFKSVINDMYAKDISKKVRSTFKTKVENGEFIGAFAPYGYKKHPHNKNKIIIDEDAAVIIKRIFSTYWDGYGLTHIARILNEENILCPSLYKASVGEKYQNRAKTLLWSHDTIRKMLLNPVYAGDMVQHKSEIISYKVKVKKSLPQEKYVVVPNTHEAIIDREMFNSVQNMIKKKSHYYHGDNRTEHLLTGIIVCGRCGARYNFVRQAGCAYMVAICSKYSKYGKEYCTRAAIKENDLNNYVLNNLRSIIKEKLDKANLIDSLRLGTQENRIQSIRKQADANNTRLTKVQALLKNIYEDKVSGLISESEFEMFADGYRKELELLTKQSKELQQNLVDTRNTNQDKLLEYVRSYVDLDSVTKPMLVNLIDKIVIHDKDNIEIHYKFTE